MPEDLRKGIHIPAAVFQKVDGESMPEAVDRNVLLEMALHFGYPEKFVDAVSGADFEKQVSVEGASAPGFGVFVSRVIQQLIQLLGIAHDRPAAFNDFHNIVHRHPAGFFLELPGALANHPQEVPGFAVDIVGPEAVDVHIQDLAPAEPGF